MPVSVEIIAKDFHRTTGEGPFYDDSNGKLYTVDILDTAALSFDTKTGGIERRKFDGYDFCSFIVPCQGGGFMLGLDRFMCYTKDLAAAPLEVIAEVDTGTKNRFNDGKCDPVGRLYGGTMAFESAPAVLELGKGSLYCLHNDLKISQCASKIDLSNGLAWTKDNRTLFFIDSIPRKVYAFDYDVSTGNLSNQRVAVDFNRWPKDEIGLPDGMTIDTDDNVYVACYFGGKVVKFDMHRGERLEEYKIPGVKRSTSCCFGGPNLDELYVTCAPRSLTPKQWEETPNEGCIFKITGLGSKGFPNTKFAGR